MTETDTSAEAAWIAHACEIFDEHAQALGWERPVYSDNLRALAAKVEALEARCELLRQSVNSIRAKKDTVDRKRRRHAARIKALEAENALLKEGVAGAYMRGMMDERDRERERAAQVAEQWIAKDMWEQMGREAMEQNAIARQIAAAIRKGDE